MFFLLCRLVSTVAGSVYPTYASYKAIKSNDLQKLEVWLMYWVVMGTVMAAESTVEWLFSWFPFYYEFKTLVILWLVLPQIQGSTYLYVAHVHPFLASHEEEIDAALADTKVRAKKAGLEWLNKAVHRLRELVVGSLAPQLFANDTTGDAVSGPAPSQAPTDPPPAYHHGSSPTSGLYNLAGNYIRQYGPAAVAAGAALLQPMNGRAPSVRAAPNAAASSRADQMRSLGVGAEQNVASASASGMSSTLTRVEARRRRAELEAQLAALEPDSSTSSFPSSPSSHSTRSASSSVPLSATTQASQRIFHPRSASAGPYPTSLSAAQNDSGVPRDPVAARIERSFVGGYGFEEIRKEELGDYPPVVAAAMQRPSLSTASPGGSWWRWGAGQPTGAEEQEKKDA